MATIQEQIDFIKFMGADAVKAEAKYKIPASLIIAQAALESGWGAHVIGQYGLFGMKYMKRHPKKVEQVTKEFINGKEVTIVDNFADYDTLYDSIADYCWLISSTEIYKPWYNEYISTGDLKGFVAGLASRYSTSNAQKYTQVVMNIANMKLVRDGLSEFYK